MEEACFIVAAQARWYQSVKQGSRWTSPATSKKPPGKYVAAAPRRRRGKGKPATSEAAASNSPPWPRLCLSFALSHSVSSRAAATAAPLHFRPWTRFSNPGRQFLFNETVECCKLGKEMVLNSM